MNLEQKQKLLKRYHTSKKAKKITAILLVICVLISSAYAFMTAHQTKDNMFTVGNIRLELHEDGWESNTALTVLEKDGTRYQDGSEYINKSKLSNIITGEPITKDPTILNVGKNPAHVYMSVDMPTVKINDVWVDLFDTDYNNSSKWQLFNTQTLDDGRHVYYYYYNEELYPDEETETLFSTITLKDSVYDRLNLSNEFTVIVNGYGSQINGDPDDDWDNITPPDPYDVDFPIYNLTYLREDSSVFAKEKKYPGDPIEMKFNNTLVKQNFSFDWVEDDGTVAYEGMPMPAEDLNLNANYTRLTNVEPSGYLTVTFTTTRGLTVTGANEDSPEYPSEPTTVVVPSSISVYKDSETEYHIEGAYLEHWSRPYSSFGDLHFLNLKTDTIYNDTEEEVYLSEMFNKFTTDGIVANIPVIEISASSKKDAGLGKVAKKLVLPDTIQTVSYGVINNSIYSNDSILEEINIPYSCEKISTLECNSNLTNITLPNSLTELGQYVFNGTKISELTIPPSLKRCGRLGIVGEYEETETGVTSIWQGLQKINISDLDAWCNIDYLPYGGESSDETIGIKGENTKLLLNGNEVSGDIILNNITRVSEHAFINCDKITSVTLPSGVIKIGNRAFSDCDNLIHLNIPDSVEHIGAYAIYDCEKLDETYTLSENTNYVGEWAFYDGYSINEITVLNENINVGDVAFGQILNVNYTGSTSTSDWGMCYLNKYTDAQGFAYDEPSHNTLLQAKFGKVGDFYIPDSVTEIKTGAFGNNQDYITNVRLSNNLVTIGRDVFKYVYIKQISLPDTIESIGEDAFYSTINIIYTGNKIPIYAHNYRNFGSPSSVNGYVENGFIYDGAEKDTIVCYVGNEENVIIPNTVKTIKSRCFYNCSQIKTIQIPNSVTAIYKQAFANCNNLTELVIPENQYIYGSGGYAFDGCSCPIYMSQATYDRLLSMNGWAFNTSDGSELNIIIQ